MEQSLICNYQNCKTTLTDIACVTKCLHIFCKNHAIQSDEMDKKCHVCNTILDGDFDVVEKNISPTEGDKAVLLSGYSFEIISDAISRAINFWEYQINTNIMKYKLQVENMKSQLYEKERETERLILQMKHYIKKRNEKDDYLKRENEKLTISLKNFEKKLAAKRQEVLNMQKKFEEIRRNSMASIITRDTEQMELEEFEVACSQQSTGINNNKQPPPPTPVFVFNPTFTPRTGSSGSSYKSPVLSSHLF